MEGQPDKPTYSQIEFFLKAMRAHDKVSDVESIDEQIYRIFRTDNLRPITVYLTNLYTVGYADVIDITAKHREINCIVTMSNWNGFTRDARTYASEKRTGLFYLSELMGAMNWTAFWKYRKKRTV